MIEMHLKQPGFLYNVCGPFTNNQHQTHKFKETGDSRYILWNQLDKTMSSTDLADMQLKSRCNKGIRFLLCVIDVFSKYALIIIPLKDKKKVKLLLKYFKIC